MTVHELKTLPEYFEAVNEGVKTFEIRKNDRNYQVNDFLLLKEFDGTNYTGREVFRQVCYMTNYGQADNYVVLAIENVPFSFKDYLILTDKEKSVFKHILSHIHLYGLSNRDVINTFWDMVDDLLGHRQLSDSDQQWYMEYWNED